MDSTEATQAPGKNLRDSSIEMEEQTMITIIMIEIITHQDKIAITLRGHIMMTVVVRMIVMTMMIMPFQNPLMHPMSASTSAPTQSLQKVTGFPNFSSKILATGAKEYLGSWLSIACPQESAGVMVSATVHVAQQIHVAQQ